ncbi:hypothetical protein DNTS_022805 [Danionella cerebrum]|uniref:PDZ domain-containing protein n=1 Tax=Danionella cerebrum TaxID=2873325 RepID=A0A553MTP1_9TELE|nr:hypothetical protein DNTS_022805 [Danionella translucida]
MNTSVRQLKQIMKRIGQIKVTPGSKASLVNLCPGDIILGIQGLSTDGMNHAEAQNKIKDSTDQLVLKIERPVTKLWSPQVSEEGKVNPFKINLEAEKQFLYVSSGYSSFEKGPAVYLEQDF